LGRCCPAASIPLWSWPWPARSAVGRSRRFPWAFEEAGFDQLPFARVVAEKYRTEHFEEHVKLDPMRTLEKLATQFDEPFADSSALACLRVCEVAGKHVKVALTGDGGDERLRRLPPV